MFAQLATNASSVDLAHAVLLLLFAVWCYLPRFVRKLCWNESSRSFGKSCSTPLKEPLFCLRWSTKVWVWSIFVSLSTRCLTSHLSASRRASHVHLSHWLFLRLFGSRLLTRNTESAAHEMKQLGICKSWICHTVNPSWRAKFPFFQSGLSHYNILLLQMCKSCSSFCLPASSVAFFVCLIIILLCFFNKYKSYND